MTFTDQMKNYKHSNGNTKKQKHTAVTYKERNSIFSNCLLKINHRNGYF